MGVKDLKNVHEEGCEGIPCTCKEKKRPKTIEEMLKQTAERAKKYKDYWGLA